MEIKLSGKLIDILSLLTQEDAICLLIRPPTGDIFDYLMWSKSELNILYTPTARPDWIIRIGFILHYSLELF